MISPEISEWRVKLKENKATSGKRGARQGVGGGVVNIPIWHNINQCFNPNL